MGVYYLWSISIYAYMEISILLAYNIVASYKNDKAALLVFYKKNTVVSFRVPMVGN